MVTDRPTCKKCKFNVGHVCRRMPPTPFLAGPPKIQGGPPLILGMLPSVDDKTPSCGEYREEGSL
jgi:hypothetical protein